MTESQTTEDAAFRAALTELLIALPALPETWPPGAVQEALNRAISVYQKIDDLKAENARLRESLIRAGEGDGIL